MGKSIQTVLKRLFAALLLLNTVIIVIIINITITNYNRQRETLIDMGNTILRVFEASRPIILSGAAGNTHLKGMFEEMFDLNTIKNIVIYQDNGEVVFSLNPFNGVINTHVHERFKVETGDSIVLYNPIHFSHMNGGRMMGMGRIQNSQQGSNVVIAIELSKQNLNDLRRSSVVIFAISMMVELLIFFLYFRMQQVVLLYNKSLIKLKNTEKEAATGRLAAILAHEIKNPLSSIAGLISYAQKKETDEKTADVLSKTQGEITRLSDIVNGFLSYGRTLDLELADIDIKPLINKTCELLSHDAAQKDIFFNISGGGFHCLADQNKMLQVFVNLILNAIDASPKSETVDVALDPSKKKVTITNKLSKPFTHEKEKIFEPFFTTKAKGTGLGLAITKKILEQHGFEVEAVSTDPFSITIIFDRNKIK